MAGFKPCLEYIALRLRDRTSGRPDDDEALEIIFEYTAKQQTVFDQGIEKTIDKLLVLRSGQLLGPLRRYVESKLLKLA